MSIQIVSTFKPRLKIFNKRYELNVSNPNQTFYQPVTVRSRYPIECMI